MTDVLKFKHFNSVYGRIMLSSVISILFFSGTLNFYAIKLSKGNFKERVRICKDIKG